MFSTCWLLVEPVVDTMSFKTTNQIPVAFEGSIKDAKGNTLKVPWPGGLELNCQVILPRNHYSKRLPRDHVPTATSGRLHRHLQPHRQLCPGLGCLQLRHGRTWGHSWSQSLRKAPTER